MKVRFVMVFFTLGFIWACSSEAPLFDGESEKVLLKKETTQPNSFSGPILRRETPAFVAKATSTKDRKIVSGILASLSKRRTQSFSLMRQNTRGVLKKTERMNLVGNFSSKSVRLMHPNGSLERVWSLEKKNKVFVRNGTERHFYLGGKVREEIHYNMGKIDGNWIRYFRNGHKRFIRSYVNGIPNGLWISWYPNGKMEMSGRYVNGVREGKWKTYSPNGKLLRTILFVKGRIDFPALRNVNLFLKKVQP